MHSASAVSWEIDDMPKAAEELISGLGSEFTPGRSSIGIIYCDADADVGEIGRILHERLGFDIIGLTSTVTFEKKNGFCDMGIVLTVITGDDVGFAAGATEPLTCDNFTARVKEAYDNTASGLGSAPRLILSFAPYIASITAENYIEALDKASGCVPVFGGVATDHWDMQTQKTFMNGKAYAENLVFLLIAGNVRPKFALEHDFAATLDRTVVITKSDGNRVERVDDISFKDYLSSSGPIPDQEDVLYHYQSTPFSVEFPDYVEGERPVVLTLCTFDHKTSSGGFLAKMPEGSKIRMNVLQSNNLEISCRKTMAALLDRMREEKDYAYSMIFVTSCNARYLVLGGAKKREAEIVSATFAGMEGVSAMGFYAFGEICPTSIKADGRALNRFHNCSISACAI